MTTSQLLTRTVAAIGVCAASALILPSAASAETLFDDPPPSTHLCASGLGDATVEAETHADEDAIAPGDVSFEIDEGAGTGANVAWVNTDTWQFGSILLTPQGDDAEPEATVTTGPGKVLAAIYGIYTNGEGETCVLLPGVSQNVAVPAPAAAP